MANSDVVAEIERYIVMPGLAASDKVGMMKILALREKAKDALGEQFELAAFDDAELKNGVLPLSILEQVVDDYIATTRIKPSSLSVISRLPGLSCEMSGRRWPVHDFF